VEDLTEIDVRPFAIATGVGVDLFHWQPEFDSLRANVAGAGSDWDVVEMPGDLLERGERAGLLSESPASVAPRSVRSQTTSAIAPAPAGYDILCLAYRQDRWHRAQAPGWREFWDTTHNPGLRTVRDDPPGNLESALLADGVPMTGLYPLDVERALKKLTALKRHMGFWTTDPSVPFSQLADNIAAMAVAPCTIRGAANDMIAYSTRAVIARREWWAFAAGTKNIESAVSFSTFIRQSSPAKAQLLFRYWVVDSAARHEFASALGNAHAFESAILDSTLTLNDHWWSVNGARVDQRWRDWRTLGR
jgi:putative spermidine/putrescine transport system substrate-binding protein